MRVLAILGLLVFSSIAAAADRAAKIKDLMDAEGLSQMFEQQRQSGRETAQKMVDQMLDRATAALNMTPEVKAQFGEIAQEFVNNAMPAWTTQEVVDAWGKYYGAKFSDDELDQLIAFYRTPLGQKDVAASAEALVQINTEFQARYKDQVTKATDQYVKRLQQMVRDCNCKKPASGSSSAPAATAK